MDEQMKNLKRWETIRTVCFVIAAITVLCFADLTANYWQSMSYYMDGTLACTSVLHKLFGIFGAEDTWTVDRFYSAYSLSLRFVGGGMLLAICSHLKYAYDKKEAEGKV